LPLRDFLAGGLESFPRLGLVLRIFYRTGGACLVS
jgi:hypothetical protein